MDRVFLDANVLFSAAYDPQSGIAALWKMRDIELVTSRYAAAEALRNIAEKRPQRLPDLDAFLRKVGLAPEAKLTGLPAGIELPAKDHPILLAAMACAASHLITGDKHFRVHFGRVIGGVLVMRPGDYLRSKQR